MDLFRVRYTEEGDDEERTYNTVAIDEQSAIHRTKYHVSNVRGGYSPLNILSVEHVDHVTQHELQTK